MLEALDTLGDVVGTAFNASANVESDEVIDILAAAMLAEAAENNLWIRQQRYNEYVSNYVRGGGHPSLMVEYGLWMEAFTCHLVDRTDFQQWLESGDGRDLGSLRDIADQFPVTAFDNALHWEQKLQESVECDPFGDRGGGGK